jgi:PucR-like helix-turn-helix protein/diguanylate cyclase with GGDEF domain
MAIAQRNRASLHQIRSELAARLQARRSEIEQAARTRIYAVADPTQVTDPEYAEGLRGAVSAALDYGFASIERGEERAPPVPAALLAQSRLAARSGVSLDTVLRRCFAGYTLLGDFVMKEAEDGALLHDEALQHVLRAQAALFDRLIAAVTEEYSRGTEGRADSAEERRAKRVRKLLDGELVDTSELRYDFEVCHLGAIAWGRDAAEGLRSLAAILDRRLLMVRGGEALWAWLGGRCRVDRDDIERIVTEVWPVDVPLALGEPGEGLPGWRLTHRQARAAFAVIPRAGSTFVRYADVALLASMLQDDLLVTSLHELYLVPLAQERDGGQALRETLRAYFEAGRNASSAAAALGVNRDTIANRLRVIEQRLSHSLNTCGAEVEAALRLEDLDRGVPLHQ